MSPPPLQQLTGANLTWADVHLAGSLIGLALIGYGFYVMANNIYANLGIINEVMAEVKRIRTERGLD